jgi:hypothetical protein
MRCGGRRRQGGTATRNSDGLPRASFRPAHKGARGRPYSVKSVGRYKRQSMTYDVECLKLAKHFLHNKPNNDTDKNRQELAQRIQDAVEDFLSELQQK